MQAIAGSTNSKQTRLRWHKPAQINQNDDTKEKIRKGLLVGDPGIEPGMGRPGGVTVRCRTLQHVALTNGGGLAMTARGVNH